MRDLTQNEKPFGLCTKEEQEYFEKARIYWPAVFGVVLCLASTAGVIGIIWLVIYVIGD